MTNRYFFAFGIWLLFVSSACSSHAAAQSNDSPVIYDYNGQQARVIQLPANSWAIRIGPLSKTENADEAIRKITAVDEALSGKEVLFVTRQDTGAPKPSLYGEIRGLQPADAERACNKAKSTGSVCALYDIVLYDIGRRAFLRQFSLFQEPHKIGIAAQECYEKAVASSYAANLVSCFYLEYAYYNMLVGSPEPFWQGQANLTKQNLAYRLEQAFAQLKATAEQQQAFLQIWQHVYAETTSWYSAMPMRTIRKCVEVGIGTGECP